jgi:hypothetical protein
VLLGARGASALRLVAPLPRPCGSFDAKKDRTPASSSEGRRAGAQRLELEAARVSQGAADLLDETWTTTNMAPTYNKATKGQRCLGYVPVTRHTTTFGLRARHRWSAGSLVLDAQRPGLRPGSSSFYTQLRAGDIVVMTTPVRTSPKSLCHRR